MARVNNAARVDDAEIEDVLNAVVGVSYVLAEVSARSFAAVDRIVTPTQYRTLVVLQREGRMNLNRLATLLDVNASTAMRMVDRLTGLALVTRRDNPGSRREVLVGLSAAGRRLVNRVATRRRREIARVVTGMSAGQRAALVTSLAAFADGFGVRQTGTDTAARLGW